MSVGLRWIAVTVVAVLGAVAPVTALRAAVLGLGGLALLPLVGWMRSVSFTPPVAAAAAAVTAAVLLGAGQAVPVGLVAGVIVGAVTGGVIAVAEDKVHRSVGPWVSLLVLLVLTGAILPRVGLISAPRPLLFGIDLGAERALGVMAVLLLAAGVGAVGNVATSRIGREIVIVAATPDLGRRSGIRLDLAKARAGVLSGAIAALAGVLVTLDLQALPPGSEFGLSTWVTWLAIAVIGGVASIGGAVAAALLVAGSAALLGVPEIVPAGVGLAVAAAVGSDRGILTVREPSGAAG